MVQVLIVTDDLGFGALLSESLEAQAINCDLDSDIFANTDSVDNSLYRKIQSYKYDICILYVSRDNDQALQLLENIRTISNLPVFLLLQSSSVLSTGQSQSRSLASVERSTIISAYEKGADDVILLPLSSEILSYKIKAFSKRIVERDNSVTEYHIGSFLFNSSTQTLNLSGNITHLTGKESALLTLLASNQGHTIARTRILVRLWGADTYFNARSLSVYVNHLRHKLSADPTISIVNMKNGGYKLLY